MDFKNAKIIVCLGTGGVGKTTVAATLGLLAAQQGMKTLVMTIDPSKRLAQTLGIEGQKEITKVPFKDGELYATTVDHKTVFDEFLRKSIQKKGISERIFSNKLYQELSTTLSGSQEFTCLEVLYQNFSSGKFDLIILDTPPSHHAMDFLHAPQKLSQLFQQEVVQWFSQTGEQKSFFKTMFRSGTQKVLGLLESITGSEFVKSLKEFFQHLGPWSEQILKRTDQFHALLTESSTHFYLIAAPDEASMEEGAYLAREIYQGGYALKTLIFNRAFAPWTDAQFPEGLVGNKEIVQDLRKQFEIFSDYYKKRQMNVQNFMQMIPQKCQGILVPEFEQDIADLKTLEQFSMVFPSETNS